MVHAANNSKVVAHAGYDTKLTAFPGWKRITSVRCVTGKASDDIVTGSVMFFSHPRRWYPESCLQNGATEEMFCESLALTSTVRTNQSVTL